jgi:hypothetical protein
MPPPGSPGQPSRFQPRFTLGLLYVAGFFFLFCLLWVAPPLLDLFQRLPPGATPEEEQRMASELARRVVQPRLGIAFAAALVATAVGAYAGILPGLRRVSRAARRAG